MPEKIWGNTNDPSEHNNGKFRYLVHGLNPFAISSMPMASLQHAISKRDNGENPDIDASYGDQSINLYDQPERVAERVSLSMSLVDQDHLGTWGEGGLILNVPEDNIIATSRTDLGSMNCDPAFLKSQFAENAKLTGDELMKASIPTIYNEVVAFANVDGSKITVAGFFYKTNSLGQPMDQTIADKMKMHARQLSLPVIAIQNPPTYPRNEIIQKDNELAVHLDGKRYLLSGWKDSNFEVIDDNKRCDFVSPDQLEHVLAFLRNKNFEESDLNEIRNEYQKVDEERQRAKVVFDEDGNVESLKQRTGYGALETQYTVSAAGYAHSVNIDLQTAEIQKSMFSRGIERMDSGTSIYKPLSRITVEQIASEASRHLNDEQKAVFSAWLETILPEVDQKNRQTYGHERFGYYKKFDGYHL